MKIQCDCGAIIVDQTDYLQKKGYVISDTQWYQFWDSIDEAIENTSNDAKEIEDACMSLRKQNLFKIAWECSNCGKLYIDGDDGKLISYSPDSKKYNKALDKKK